LAAAGLAIIIVYHLDEVTKASGGSGFLPIFNPVLRGAFFEIPALGLSVASFAFSWKRHQIIISILLLISGSIMVADRIAIGIRYLTILTVPEPIIGLLNGLVVLLLGLAKTIMIAIVFRRPPRRRIKGLKSESGGLASSKPKPNTDNDVIS